MKITSNHERLTETCHFYLYNGATCFIFILHMSSFFFFFFFFESLLIHTLRHLKILKDSRNKERFELIKKYWQMLINSSNVYKTMNMLNLNFTVIIISKIVREN